MASIGSLSRAVSGMMASQSALQATAHNLSNVNTTGYVRQQVLMKESSYVKVGNGPTTDFLVGLGTGVQDIRQVRDMFLDMSYREESGRQGFYNAQANAIEEIEVILGETEGESFSQILDNLFSSINELSKHPDGLETRGTFVQSSVLFVNKANLVMDQLNDYQMNQNSKVIDTVNEINGLGKEIFKLNDLIVRSEVNGDNANDYRDARNNALDKLSNLVDISYREDKVGNVFVKVEGYEFVTISDVNEMDLAPAEPFSLLVTPIWKSLGREVFNLDETITPEKNNDLGKLKGLLLARGTRQANHTDTNDPNTYEQAIKPSIIMNAQAQFDVLVNGIVTMINDIVAPKSKTGGPYGLDGSQYTEVFKRKYMDRYDSSGNFESEVATNLYSLYSAGNLEVNPLILEDYDKIALSVTLNEVGDNQKVEEIITAWQQPFAPIQPGGENIDINEYYTSYISDVGNVGSISKVSMTNQEMIVSQIQNQRSSLMGVSSDEELGNMMKYQHAYNASARVVTVVDQMIEQIVTSLGIVGR